jgi:ubiquinone/menaquinone biosynthesis C-methylase UbiE
VPTPDFILRHVHGYWASAIFVAAIEHKTFDLLEAGPLSADELALKASLPVRGAQALLDALIGLQLVRKVGDRYANSDDASIYLVRGKPDYLGGYATMVKATWRLWEGFSEAVAAGKPLQAQESHNPSNTFWEDLVPAIAPLAFIPARATAERLGIASRGAFHLLDIAGGSGAFSMIWLKLNERGWASQIDWPNVNAIAKNYMTRFGVADRFVTIDGDMERIPLDQAAYDYVIYASVAHGLPPDRNIAMFKKIRSALKSGGTLVIVGLMANAERTGHPLLMMFNANMLLNTERGSTYAAAEYEPWLRTAGFTEIAFQSLSEMPYTVVYAS